MDGETPGIVTIRKLSARSLEKAKEARQISVVQLSTKLGPDVMKLYRDTREERPLEAVVDPAVQRYGQYDRDTVLTQGVESWTFDIPKEEGLIDLDEPAAELLFHEIIDLSDPPKAVVETEGKGV